MAKITEAIDLTLDCWFAGDSNKRLLPDRWLKNSFNFALWFLDSKLENAIRRHVESHFPNREALDYLDQPEENYCMSYLRFFKEFPQEAYDDMLGYGDPNFCGMCGDRTNLLNRHDWHNSCMWCFEQGQLNNNTVSTSEGKGWNIV